LSLGLDLTWAEGHQLQRLTDINRILDGTTSANGLPHYNAGPAGPTTRRFGAYNRIITDLSDGEAEYKAATLTMQRRYADNYSFYAAVTWSEDRDHDSNERNFAGIQAEDFNNLELNWGPSNRDQEWKVILNGVWDTPLWGIGLSGSFQYYTGQPFNPTTNVDFNGDSNFTDRPTVNGVHFGRNSQRQPDLYTMALRLSKSFDIGPGDIAVFAECFNCTDHTNPTITANNQIWGPGQNPLPTFGDENALFQTSGAFAPRTIQLGLRFDF
jgi:hypothetical protein